MRGCLLPVNEIFFSLQGEGLRTGEPSLFIRLAGCNLKCWYCDTDFNHFTEMSVAEIINCLSRLNPTCKWVVLTGGEPLIQPAPVLRNLLRGLRAGGYKVQLETNGTRPCGLPFDHITVSPKQENIHPGLQPKLIKEVKILVQAGDRPRVFLTGVPHFLQPVDGGNAAEIEANVAYCRRLAAAQPKKWRLSLQMHKVWGIR